MTKSLTKEDEKLVSNHVQDDERQEDRLPKLQCLFNKIVPVEYMGIQIVDYNYTNTIVTLSAPLIKNQNDKGTAFAGSIYSTLVLSGWTLISLLLQDYCTSITNNSNNNNNNVNNHINDNNSKFIVVVASSSTKYIAPVKTSTFNSVAFIRQSQQKQQPVDNHDVQKEGLVYVPTSSTETATIHDNNKLNHTILAELYDSIQNKGKGKINVDCILLSNDNQKCATFTALYVASKMSSSSL